MGMETAEHSHNLFLQIIISMGVCGIVVFAILLLFFFQKSSEYLKTPANDFSFTLTSAGVSSVISFLIMGMFDYVWYNYRMFFLFWIVVALSIATVRVGKSEIRKKQTIDRFSDCNYSIEINVDERNRA
jgi:O-antigen ligase